MSAHAPEKDHPICIPLAVRIVGEGAAVGEELTASFVPSGSTLDASLRDEGVLRNFDAERVPRASTRHGRPNVRADAFVRVWQRRYEHAIEAADPNTSTI